MVAVTIAPELPGAVGLVKSLASEGVLVSLGHSDATAHEAGLAFDAGARTVTHLFNAMRPIDRREPGPVIALLEDPRVTVELITDGVHVDSAIYRHVTRSAGPDRVSLITDAMAATGMADGVYHLGPLAVDVVDGVARVAGTDTIAGSGLGRPDPMAAVEAHRDDVPEDGGSPGTSTELRPASTTPGAGDPGSLDSKASASGGGPPPTTDGD